VAQTRQAGDDSWQIVAAVNGRQEPARLLEEGTNSHDEFPGKVLRTVHDREMVALNIRLTGRSRLDALESAQNNPTPEVRQLIDSDLPSFSKDMEPLLAPRLQRTGRSRESSSVCSEAAISRMRQFNPGRRNHAVDPQQSLKSPERTLRIRRNRTLARRVMRPVAYLPAFYSVVGI
jgi:hypothetical protein